MVIATVTRDDCGVGEKILDGAGAALFPGFQTAQQFQYRISASAFAILRADRSAQPPRHNAPDQGLGMLESQGFQRLGACLGRV
jgi:hypothetical protein